MKRLGVLLMVSMIATSCGNLGKIRYSKCKKVVDRKEEQSLQLTFESSNDEHNWIEPKEQESPKAIISDDQTDIHFTEERLVKYNPIPQDQEIDQYAVHQLIDEASILESAYPNYPKKRHSRRFTAIEIALIVVAVIGTIGGSIAFLGAILYLTPLHIYGILFMRYGLIVFLSCLPVIFILSIFDKNNW